MGRSTIAQKASGGRMVSRWLYIGPSHVSDFDGSSVSCTLCALRINKTTRIDYRLKETGSCRCMYTGKRE